MTLADKIATYYRKRDFINAQALAITTLNYDQETIAPKKGNAYRQEMLSLLIANMAALTKEKEYVELIYDLVKYDEIDKLLKKELNEFIKNYEKNKNVPIEFQQQFSLTMYQATSAWQEARATNDYHLFEPHLTKMIDYTKQYVNYRPNVKTIYDELLNDYQEGLTNQKVADFFQVIENRLVPFIKKVATLNLTKPAFLNRPVSLSKQREVTEMIRNYLLFDNSYTYIGESAHPFSTTLSPNDTRITTTYHEDQFTSNIFSIIHEIGHGTYNHQVAEKLYKTCFADNMSMTMHESQSRFLENNIARQKEFWIPLYEKLQRITSVLDDISLDEFIFGINYPSLSLIRIEADELTYPLHILVRYNLENKIFNQGVISDLNTLWQDEYEKILGIRPQLEKEGILQDIHWSQGSFGYFPTYALGSAFAAQFYEKLAKDLPVKELLAKGDYGAIRAWNKNNIHQYGGYYSADEMIEKVTGKAFDANIYCDYLIDKYTKLLKL